MVIDGYIIVNTTTGKLLKRKEEYNEFDYVFEDVDTILEYISDMKINLSEYVVHHIEGEVYEVTATTRSIN